MKFYLAPLADFTNAPFRKLCHEGGADLTYTEMVSAAGLAHGSSPTRHLLETMPGEGKVACQIFGAKETDIAEAARQIELMASRFTELNLNAGCPMVKVTREGAGAKLINDPAKIGRLLRVMSENTSLPITLKTRLGPHPQDRRIFEILDAAGDVGVKKLIIHARYTSQMHGGPIDLETLAEVVRRSSVPIIGNGSIVDLKSAAAMATTGVKAIMIGRAALANPSIFAALKGEGTAALDKMVICRRHLEYLLKFREQLVERFPNDHIPSADGFASVKMHTHLFRYFNGRPGAAELRRQLNSVRTIDEINAIISRASML